MITALAFLALGLYLAASAWRLPEGPGAFPGAIGAAMALLSLPAFRDRGSGGFRVENSRTIAATLALTVLYLLVWGTGAFALKTALYLVLLLRLYGQRWRTAVTVAVVM